MIKLRDAVVAADTKEGDVAGELEKLNDHVFHHMNTKIVRPIELVNTYNRQASAAIQAANQDSGTDLYAEGTAQCEKEEFHLLALPSVFLSMHSSRVRERIPKK